MCREEAGRRHVLPSKSVLSDPFFYFNSSLGFVTISKDKGSSIVLPQQSKEINLNGLAQLIPSDDTTQCSCRRQKPGNDPGGKKPNTPCIRLSLLPHRKKPTHLSTGLMWGTMECHNQLCQWEGEEATLVLFVL